MIQPETLQRRASDPEVSSWVGASAGSGKTKVLTDRMLRLLLSGVAPDKILAITFTNAAAAEMANRLNETLAKWAILEPRALDEALDKLQGENGHDAVMRDLARQLFTRIIDSSIGVRIHTIHGFCQSVLRRFPIEAGLSPHFKLLDDRSSNELLRSVINDLLEQVAKTPHSDLALAVGRISIYFAEARFDNLIDEIIAERHRFQMLFDYGDLATIPAHICDFLQVPKEADSRNLIEAACADDAIEADLLREAVAQMLKHGTIKTDHPKAEKISNWLALSPAARMVAIDSYRSAYLTLDGSPRAKGMTDKLAQSYPHLEEALHREAQRLYNLQERCNAIDLARSSQDLLFLAYEILQAYAARKEAQAQVDYEDLILRTRGLLQQDIDAAWVHYKLDGGIDHVLLDESQDTNPEQWDLIEALVREFFVGESAVQRNRTLFAVGDAKQSIFSFQRADPTIFTRMHNLFAKRIKDAKKEFRPVDLSISFRSTAPILALVDKVFEPPLVHEGVSEEAPQHQVQRIGDGGLVEVWPLLRKPEKAESDPWLPQVLTLGEVNPVMASAQKIAHTVADWLKSGEILDSLGRPIVPNDIMVLVRNRTAFVPALVRALKQLDVPVAGADRMVLTKELAVADLLALARVLLLTEDDMNLAIVLRSPLVGFSDEELFEIAYDRTGYLWNALAHSTSPFAVAAIEWLQYWRSRADFIAPYELFSGILNSTCPADKEGSGRRAFMARLGAEAFDPLDEFLSATIAYEQQHAPSLQGFLGWIAVQPVEIKREPRKVNAGDAGEVTIMTVHGSKGLQAPIVFLADTASSPTSRKGPHILWQDGLDDAPAFPLWASSTKLQTPHCTSLRDNLKRRADEEYRRLLYVALTRAQDRLYCVGWERGRKVSDTCWHNLIEPAIRAIGSEQSDGSWRLAQPQTVPIKAQARQLSAVPEKPTVPLFARIKPLTETKPVRPFSPSRLVMDEGASISPLEKSDTLRRFERGRLIHRLLQTLPDLPPERWKEAAASYLKHSLDEAGIAALTEEVISVLRHPQFGIVFGPGSQAEVSIAGLVQKNGEDFALSGQIDRLVVTPGEILLVDFKSNRPPPGEASQIPKPYLMQLAAYRSALMAIYPTHTIRSALIWTNGPRLMEVMADQLDTVSLDLAG